MFSSACIDYRAGIKLTGQDGVIRTYSLDFFMHEFVAYWDIKAKVTMQAHSIAPTSKLIPLSSPATYWRASQSIIMGKTPLSSIDCNDPSTHFSYLINGHEVICPHYTNCYVIDENLLTAYPDFFARGPEISYAAIARFMLQDSNPISHTELAKAALNIINGSAFTQPLPEITAMPVLLAALLLAEPRRNPSTFLPTLMILELIAQERISPSGAPYHWGNCIQNTQLIMQKTQLLDDFSQGGIARAHGHFLLTRLYPRLLDMPTIDELNSGKKVEMTASQKQTFNASKKYNGAKKNQNKVMPHEISMQSGGYFPATHRFSFSEIAAKRSEGISTLSDQKCFIAISDFLLMLGLAETVHAHYVNASKNKTDSDRAFLRGAILPFLWRMQQARYPSEGIPKNLKYIPFASCAEIFRDNLQRAFTSPEGSMLCLGKTA